MPSPSFKIILLCLILLAISINGTSQTYKVEEVSYEFVVEEIMGINSKYDDFSPVLFNDQLIFTSGRESNLVLQGENNWGKTGFYNLFEVTLNLKDSTENKTSPSALFDKDLSNNNHTGPACFNADQTIVFYTQLSKRKKKIREVRKPQLYMAEKIDGKWQNIELLPFCDPEYSFGHPTWNNQTNTLYFSSTMPGGKGGRDIYSVQRNEDGSWQDPVNIQWNTEDDEMFPFIIGKDLFFSSDRPGGKGKLDIYWKLLNTDEPLQNVEQLNTEEDDHGIFITPNYLRGCFAKQINGNDDLFLLKVSRNVRVTNELAGQFTYRNIGTEASNLELELIYEDEFVLNTTTDSSGKFWLRELPYENYTIKTKSEENLELTIFDENGRPVNSFLQDGEGLFQYKKIDEITAGTLSMLEEMNDSQWLDFTDITGQLVYENGQGMYGDSLEVLFVDEDGNVVFTEYSDERGNFTLINIPTDQNYTITVKDVEEDLFLLIYDQEGNVFAQLKQNEEGAFVYRKIDPDLANNLQRLAVEDDVYDDKSAAITGNFNYRKLEGNFNDGLTVYLYSEDGFLLDSTITNSGGQFMFRNLDPDKSYLFKMKEDDPNFVLDDFNLYVEDRYGKVLADLYRAEDGFYRHKIIDADTSTDLTQINDLNEPDFELENNNNTTENEDSNDYTDPIILTGEGFNIYFDRNSSYTNLKSITELEQLISEMKANSDIKVNLYAFTSSRDTEHYNLWLSKRRGNRIKEFMISRGISSSRISVEAYGENKLVNDCEDGVSCPEEEHAKNRRVEVIITGR